MLIRDFEDNIFEFLLSNHKIESEESKIVEEEWMTIDEKVSSEIKSIRGIYVFLKNTESSSLDISLYLGQFALYQADYQNVSAVNKDTITTYFKKNVKSEQSLTYDFYTVWLNWESQANSYRILRDEEWIGTTTLCQFVDKQVKIPKNSIEIVYWIQSIGKIYEVSDGTSIVVKLDQ